MRRFDRARGFVLFFVLQFYCGGALAASDFQFWGQVVPLYRAADDLNVRAAIQWRFGRGNADKLLTDLNVEKSWGSGWSASGGLVTLGFTHPVFSSLEVRPWLGAQYRTTLGDRSVWINRFRSEFRFLPGIANMALRLRFLTGVVHAVGGDWALVAEEELLVNANAVSASVVAGLGENRLRVGLRYDPAGGFSADLAYLNQWAFNPTAPNLMIHIPAFFINYTFG